MSISTGILAFQSTPPRGWRLCLSSQRWMTPNFNPLHREGGDFNQAGNVTVRLTISIHSTARVETARDTLMSLSDSDFNPLHREGGDHTPIDGSCSDKISIHSTARVETEARRQREAEAQNFNPLHREGGDQNSYSIHLRYNLFQSTPPRGWRRCVLHIRIFYVTFQSTPPRGWRLYSSNVSIPAIYISIHSTARVETEAAKEKNSGHILFQSTPPRGWRR